MAAFLSTVPGPVVLVGHSYGGAVISTAAAGDPDSAFVTPATAAAWRTIPSWYLVGTQDAVIPPGQQRFMARRAHACTLAQGHHFAPALPPEDLTRWLDATGRRPYPAGSLSGR